MTRKEELPSAEMMIPKAFYFFDEMLSFSASVTFSSASEVAAVGFDARNFQRLLTLHAAQRRKHHIA